MCVEVNETTAFKAVVEYGCYHHHCVLRTVRFREFLGAFGQSKPRACEQIVHTMVVTNHDVLSMFSKYHDLIPANMDLLSC